MKDRQYKWGHRINWTDIERSNRLEKDNGGHSFVPIAAKWMAGVRNWWSWYRAEIQQINCRPIGPKSISWPKIEKSYFESFSLGYMDLSNFSKTRGDAKFYSKLCWCDLKYPMKYFVQNQLLLTEFGQYFLMSSFIMTSFCCSFGPVWYQPTIFSRAINSKIYMNFLNICTKCIESVGERQIIA